MTATAGAVVSDYIGIKFERPVPEVERNGPLGFGVRQPHQMFLLVLTFIVGHYPLKTLPVCRCGKVAAA
jgi:hypothetical protein